MSLIRRVEAYPCVVCAGRCWLTPPPASLFYTLILALCALDAAAMDAPSLLSGYASGSDGEDQQDTGNKQVDVEAEDENHANFFIKPRFKAILRLYNASIKNLLRLY